MELTIRRLQYEKRRTVEIETLPFVILIKDFHEEQPAGGDGVLGHGTVFRSEYLVSRVCILKIRDLPIKILHREEVAEMDVPNDTGGIIEFIGRDENFL